jgi:tetratricopeptide (TPR) repeat protein
MSQIETLRGDYAGALIRLDEALPLARSSGDRAAEAEVLYGLANIRFRLGDSQQGLEAIQECEQLARQLGDDVLILQASNRLGTLLDSLSRLDEARQVFDEALALARRTGHRRWENTLLTNVGFLEIGRRNWDSAVANLESALAWSRETDDLTGLVFNGLNLAMAYLRRGDTEKAPPLIHVALRVGMTNESLPAQLGSIGVEGERLVATGNASQGLALLGLVKHHPSASADMQNDIRLGLEFWGPKLGLTAKEIEAGMQAGKSLELTQTAANILSAATA